MNHIRASTSVYICSRPLEYFSIHLKHQYVYMCLRLFNASKILQFQVAGSTRSISAVAGRGAFPPPTPRGPFWTSVDDIYRYMLIPVKICRDLSRSLDISLYLHCIYISVHLSTNASVCTRLHLFASGSVYSYLFISIWGPFT